MPSGCMWETDESAANSIVSVYPKGTKTEHKTRTVLHSERAGVKAWCGDGYFDYGVLMMTDGLRHLLLKSVGFASERTLTSAHFSDVLPFHG